MDTITIRQATQIDAAALGYLHVAAWHETYTGIMPDEILARLSVEKRIAVWSKVLGDPEAFGCTAVLVAEDDGLVIGFGTSGPQRDQALAEAGYSGEIAAIYVFRSHQGRGVGRSLMTTLSQALSAAGHYAASLWVLRENAPARTFYEGLGGEIVGERTDERPSATLVELAYGWRDLSRLAR